MTENNLLEVLAPVGDMERLYAALDFGADAVYLGGTAFGMRAASASFDAELLKKACDEAHSRGKRVYLTCNTLPHNDEIVHLEQFVNDALAAGVDAMIANDIGVFSLIKKYAPDMEIHVSTQAGIVNYVTANEFYNMGAKRVVLARELSLEEIRVIRRSAGQLDQRGIVRIPGQLIDAGMLHRPFHLYLLHLALILGKQLRIRQRRHADKGKQQQRADIQQYPLHQIPPKPPIRADGRAH